MLGKLIKHDIKDNIILVSFGCIAIFVSSLLLLLIISLETPVLIIFAVMTFIMAIAFAGFIVLYTIFDSINGKLFTDRGYLTLTLPVSMDKIILSKYISSLLWIFMLSISTVLGVFIVSLATGTTMDFIVDMLSTLKDFYSTPLYVLYNFIALFIELILSITLVFLILAVLNCGKIKQGKIIIGLIMYSVIETIINVIKNIVPLLPYALKLNNGELVFVKYDVFNSVGLVPTTTLNSIVFAIVFTVGGIFLLRYILKNKLELE